MTVIISIHGCIVTRTDLGLQIYAFLDATSSTKKHTQHRYSLFSPFLAMPFFPIRTCMYPKQPPLGLPLPDPLLLIFLVTVDRCMSSLVFPLRKDNFLLVVNNLSVTSREET